MAAKNLFIIEENRLRLNILSLHWGFIPGGVAAYSRYIEEVNSFASIAIKSVCIHAPDWPFDKKVLDKLAYELIKISGRLDISWVGELRKRLVEDKPDLILTHGFNGAFAAALSGIGLGIPIISSWHGEYFPQHFVAEFAQTSFRHAPEMAFPQCGEGDCNRIRLLQKNA